MSGIMLRVHHQVTGEGQDAGLAGGAHIGILDPFEIDVVRKSQNPADHLGCREADGVAPQPVHVGLRALPRAPLRPRHRRKRLAG